MIMDEDDEYFPKTPREKVMIYQILSELESVVERANSRRILWIFPTSISLMKLEIRQWVSAQHKLLARDDE
jgi:hypothetical protein